MSQIIKVQGRNLGTYLCGAKHNIKQNKTIKFILRRI